MDTDTMSYRLTTTLELPYEEAVERTREAAAAEGFGVLSEPSIRKSRRRA